MGLAILPRLPKNGPLTVFTASISPSIPHPSIKGLTQPNSPTLEEMTPQKPITVYEISVYALDFDADVDLSTGSADGNVTRSSQDKDWAVGLRIKTVGCCGVEGS